MPARTRPPVSKAPSDLSPEPDREAFMAALAERDETIAQQAAASEVLQIVNASKGDLAPVFEAIVERAMRLCGRPSAACGSSTAIERGRSVLATSL